MRDADLRALERTVREGGALEARVRLAMAYERAGRATAALETLLPARHEPEARRLLDRLPIWNGGGAVPRGSGFVDVPALTRPAKAWTFAGEHTDRGWGRPVFLASALTLVCKAASGRIVALDSVNGHLLWERPEGWLTAQSDAQAMIVEQVLVCVHEGERRVLALDLWTGVELWSLAIRGQCTLVEPGLIAFEDAGQLVCHELRDPRRAPACVWEAKLGLEPDERPVWFNRIAASDELALHGSLAGLVAFERATGKVAWAVDEPFAQVKSDSSGILAVGAHLTETRRWDTGPLRALDRSGRTLWVTEAEVSPIAVTPSFVLATTQNEGRLCVVTLDRTTGKILHSLGVLADYGGLALVRDAAYVYLYLLTFEPTLSMVEMALRALAREGRELWRISPGELGGDVFGIAPVPGRLFVLGRDGTVTCFTESAGDAR